MEIIWKERKRIMGLPISFIVYSLSKDRLFTDKGFLTKSEEQLYLYMVKDITLKRSMLQRIFGLGTVILYTSDPTEPQVLIENIPNSKDVKEIINEEVMKQKKERNVVFFENSGDVK